MSAAAKRSNDDSAMRIARALLAGRARYLEENPNGQFTLGKAADIIRAQLAIEFPKPKHGARVNGRDVIFDAIGVACDIDLTCLTRQMAKHIATAKRDILEASPSVTPEEIERRGDAYRAKYKDAACTPTALANHWAEFGRPTERRTRTAKTDVYQEPANWRDRLKRAGLPNMSADSIRILCEQTWAEIRTNYGREILSAIEGVSP